MMPPVPREFLTVREAAEWIGVSRWTLYRAIREGQLPARTIGRRMFLSSAAVRRYFEEPAA